MRILPDALQKRERLAVPSFHAAEIQGTVTIFQRIKNAIRVEELVMAQHFLM